MPPTTRSETGRLDAEVVYTGAGALAPIVYLATVVAGGAMVPGYDQLRDSISSLTESGRADILGIQSGFLLYNLLVAAFAVQQLRARGRDAGWRATFALLLLTAVCGGLMWPFAQDPVGSTVTVGGSIHLALAAIESLSSIAILTISWWKLRDERPRLLSGIALSCLLITVVFGVCAAFATAMQWPMMGLYERLTIGAFEVWLFALALVALRRPQMVVGRTRQ